MNRLRPLLFLLLVLTCALPVAEAAWFRREPPRPGKTTIGKQPVVLPAQLVNNYLIVTVKWDKRGPYNFLIDTGASTCLVSPTLAERYGQPPPPLERNNVTVQSADGDTTVLRSTILKRLQLGNARFDEVGALIYDCTPISVHLGLRIDGILGFPLFRETLLTLDYPHAQVIISPRDSATALRPGCALTFNNDRQIPLVPLRLGAKTFYALIDSGSDAAMNLNPRGLDLEYATEPRPGTIITTLTGDRRQMVGRLAQTVKLGDYSLIRPIIDVTDEFPSLGGGTLRHFSITFDQESHRVTFHRESPTPLIFPSKRTAGMSFTKVGAYWRVVGITPDSPAATAGVEVGDLVTRINDEPVESWGVQRYDQLIAQADQVAFSFLLGRREYQLKFPVMPLVP